MTGTTGASLRRFAVHKTVQFKTQWIMMTTRQEQTTPLQGVGTLHPDWAKIDEFPVECILVNSRSCSFLETWNILWRKHDMQFSDPETEHD